MTEALDGSNEAMNLRETPSFPHVDSSFLTGDSSCPLKDSSIPSASSSFLPGDSSFLPGDSSFPLEDSSFPTASSSFPPAKTKETQAHTISLLNLPPSPSAPSRGKSNKFERLFGDSTLTSLTFGNTFRFPILPSRRAVLLRGRQIKIRGRQIKIRGRQIFPGSAPKTPVFKGKVTKKGGSRGSSHISVQI